MNKLLLAAVLLSLAVPAYADIPPEKKAEAQKEVDKAKAETCEKVKTALTTKLNSKCPDQAAEAAKVTCSAAEFKHVNDLNTACMQALSGKGTKAAADAKAAKEAPPATAEAPAPAALDKNACQATDPADGSVLASATAEKSMDCRNQIKEAVTKAKCTEGVKKFKFNYQRGSGKPSSSTVYCKK